MKKLIIICSLVISPLTFANTSLASKAERKVLCNAVDKLLELEKADMALDTEACLKNTKIKSILFSEGTVLVQGKLHFRAPNRTDFKLNCNLAYVGSPDIKNIVGGLETGVNCD